jgi:hypothetical protein
MSLLEDKVIEATSGILIKDSLPPAFSRQIRNQAFAKRWEPRASSAAQLKPGCTPRNSAEQALLTPSAGAREGSALVG